MTIFLAAVLHGIVILGITFSSGAKDAGAAPGLEVLLVSDEVPTAAHNDTATYLAQRTQFGSGNTARSVPPLNRASVRSIAGHAGLPDGTSLAATGAAGADDERVLATTAAQPDIQYFSDADTGEGAGEKPLALPDHPAAELGPEDDAGPVQLRGPHRDDLWVTPDTRESILAPYLDHWRRRIERIGTLNYPIAARRVGIEANPVLAVEIRSDGKLEAARIQRSSGYPDLDHAALEILKLASPFDPFPPGLARDYRTMRFAYEWDFVGGRVSRGSVSAVP
ncbi:MAG: TonB family protein [Steroidobacteraceae bacterium]